MLDPCSGSDNIPRKPLQSSAPSALLPWPRSVSCAAYLSRRHSIVPNVPFSPCAAPLGAAARGGPQGARCVPRPAHGPHVPGSLAHCVVARSLGCGTHGGYEGLGLCLPRKQAFGASCERRPPPFWARPMRAAESVRNATWLILPVVICLSQRLSHACVDTGSAVAAMIHNNSTDRTALVPATHHSNFCPINFRWEPEKRLPHPRKAAGGAKLPNPDTGRDYCEQKASSFRFQHMWITHPGFLEVVRRNWQYPTIGSGMVRLQQKLTRLKHCLKEWNRTVFGNVFDRVAAAERDLKEADEAYDINPCDRTLVERSRCSAVLVRVLTQEEAFWKQKAGIKWAKDGERNTRYFHSLVQKRRFRGTIFEIQHEGEVLTDPVGIKRSAASFFEQLLSAEPACPDEMDRDCLGDGLTDEDRCFLCTMPMMAEVREAVFCIEPESVAGPDGFGAIFYHTCWDLVSEDVFCAVSEFFRGIAMPKSFTATTISLIPKTASPVSWSEYRPISLCNVTNKICTKLMSIRLGHVLPKVLSPSQSGFVPGRFVE
ncbi:UNVERIFIED_CONTAM: hypothetical protein Sindi_3080600 [Sesamum indicum]